MIKENLIDFYLTYKNDFVDYKTMSSYFELLPADLLTLLNIGHRLHEESVIHENNIGEG